MTHFVQMMFPNASVYGIDCSSKSIEAAKKQFPHIQFSISEEENEKMEFAEETFDLIFSAGVFHHIPFQQHSKVLCGLLKTLRTSGKFVLLELNPLNPLTVLTVKRNPIDQNAKLLTPWYAKKMLRPWGKVSTRFYCFYPNFLRKLRWSESFLTPIPFGALYASILSKKS